MARIDIIHLPFSYHLIAGMFIRTVLILYAEHHDQIHGVPYTDVDYKVFTDAARHVLNGDSPYKRHTYRYSPIIAYLVTPNIILGKHFGKFLFSVFDILISVAVKELVEHQLGPSRNRQAISRISLYCSLIWLYNPLSVGISTRGSADSVPCYFIILSLLYLQTNITEYSWNYVVSGFLLGISIHLRLYPLVFSFPMYLSLGEYKITRTTTLKDGLRSFIPNLKQVVLTLSCVITLLSLTFGMYLLYGYEFLFETYIYHLFRKDTRHNFSVLFYYSYLTMDQLAFDIVKTVTLILECTILFVLSLAFGCETKTLPFALFCQSVVLVAFNSVVTSQYFVWFLSLLPLVAHSFKLRPTMAIIWSSLWCASQSAWLVYAYYLEFEGKEVFTLLWFKSIVFFMANITVLTQLIKSYSPGYGFGQLFPKTKIN